MTSLLTFTGVRRVREVTQAILIPLEASRQRQRRREGAEGYEKAIEIDALRPINRGGKTIAATKPNSRQMATKVIVGQREQISHGVHQPLFTSAATADGLPLSTRRCGRRSPALSGPLPPRASLLSARCGRQVRWCHTHSLPFRHRR